MINKYYTIAEIAKELEINESTTRFYRDKFPDFIETIGEGRAKRYTEKALEAISIICNCCRAKKTDIEIREELESKFAINSQEVIEQGVNNKSLEVLSPNEATMGLIEAQTQALQQIAAAMQTMAINNKVIADLQQQISNLEMRLLPEPTSSNKKVGIIQWLKERL